MIASSLVQRNKFKYYSDAGHGWLAVKKNWLHFLGIADKVTQFSYIKGNTIYLEEDCDMALFLKAYKEKLAGLEPEIVEVSHRNKSPIRNYERYLNKTDGM